MNFEFKHTHFIENNGKTYSVQRAKLPKNSKFWGYWKKYKGYLRDKIQVRKEIHYGQKYWYLYRMQEKNNPAKFAKIKPYSIKNKSGLYPYQVRAVESICASILANGNAIDGSDCGTGKTYSAIKVCQELDLRPFVVCKKQGFLAWKTACKHFKVNPAVIINWELIRLGKYPFCQRVKNDNLEVIDFQWILPPGFLVIFDEVHEACGWDSLNSYLYTSAKGLTTLSLSATFGDRPFKLRSLFHVLDIMEKPQFAQWLKDRGQIVDKYENMEGVSEQQDMQDLHKMLYPKYGTRLRLTDPDVKAMFPKYVIQTLMVELPKIKLQKQESLYQKILKYRELGRKAEAVTLDLRYRQITELYKVSIFAEHARIYTAQGYSVAIFVNYLDTVHEIAKLLRTKCLITGKGGRKKKFYTQMEARNAFQSNKENIIVCTGDAGGQSLDLHDTSGNHPRISLVGPTYNTISLKQILGRTIRGGAKSVPIVKLMYVHNSIEEKVAKHVDVKIKNLDTLNDGDLNIPGLFEFKQE